MVTRTVVLDDLDGSAASESVTFAFDGVSYVIDLSVENKQKMDHALSEYLQAATQLGGSVEHSSAPVAPAVEVPVNSLRTTRAPSKQTSRPDMPAPAEEIRAWARANGWEVNDKGRVPAKVVEAFIAADNGKKGNQPIDPAAGPAEFDQPTPMSGEAQQAGVGGPTPAELEAASAELEAAAGGVETAEENLQAVELAQEAAELPVGPEWGDPPAETVGQRLQREAEERKQAEQPASPFAAPAGVLPFRAPAQ